MQSFFLLVLFAIAVDLLRKVPDIVLLLRANRTFHTGDCQYFQLVGFHGLVSFRNSHTHLPSHSRDRKFVKTTYTHIPGFNHHQG